jgi:O-antigen/teichoic acid export membrane protein
MSLIAETSFAAFFIITIVLGGGAAFMAGRAFARTWKPFTRIVPYMLLLGLAVRFLHWGLFMDATYQSWRDMKGTLISPHYFIVDTLVLIAMAALGYRLERARQMTTQYGWIYQRTSPLTWRKR